MKTTLYNYQMIYLIDLVCILLTFVPSDVTLSCSCFVVACLHCVPCSGWPHRPLSFSLAYSFSFSPPLRICSSFSASLLCHTSICALLSRAVTAVWFLSCVSFVPWYALLCHCCRLVFLSLPLPPSPPWKPNDVNVRVCLRRYLILYRHIMMLNSSLAFLVTLPCPISLSLSHFITPPSHGRTSWDRSSAHWERLWAHLPVDWRNHWCECPFNFCLPSKDLLCQPDK